MSMQALSSGCRLQRDAEISPPQPPDKSRYRLKGTGAGPLAGVQAVATLLLNSRGGVLVGMGPLWASVAGFPAVPKNLWSARTFLLI